MKKFFLVLAAALLGLGAVLVFENKKSTPQLRLPAGASEEDKEIRKRWETRMLADPATGKIPEGIRIREHWFARELAEKQGFARGSGTWNSMGPYNVGGRTRALAMDVTNEKRLLAGGVSGGVWLSEDGGQSWQRTTPAGFHPGCVSIAQDPRPGQTNTWYYISGEIYGTSASGGGEGAFYLGDGMFKSTDGGKTWAVLAPTAGGNPQTFSDLWQSGWRVIVSPTTGAVFAATYSCVYRSTNGGTAWTPVLGGISTQPFSYFTDVAVTSTGILYATFSSEGVKKGVWRSSDNGTTWADITPASFPKTYNRVVIGINPNDENEVYFLSETPGYGFSSFYISSTNWSSLLKYKYLSGDGSGMGGDWTDLSANLPATGTEFDRFANQGGYDLHVDVQPGTGHVFIGGTNLWRSTDGFTTPNNTTKIGGYKLGTTLPFFELYENHHPDLHDVLFLPSNPNVMLSASDGGLHRTEDCLAPTVVWNALNRGYVTSQFYTIVMEHTDADDHGLIGGLQDNGNFFTNTTDATTIWKQTVNGDGAHGAIPDGKPYHILSIQQGRVAKCNIDDDGNVKAFQRFDPIGRVKENYLFINPLALDPTDQKILYLPAGNRFYRQQNLDAIPLNNEWDSVSTGWTQFPDTLPLSAAFTAIGVSKNGASHRVYLGTDNNRIFRIDSAHTGAPKMTTLISPLPDPAPGTNTALPYVTCIAVDPDNPDNVLLVFSNYNIYSLWQSLNGGTTWRKVGGNLETGLTGVGAAPSVRWVNIMAFPDGSRRYFAGTSTGLYSATEIKLHSSGQPGTVWTPEGTANIGNVPVTYIDSRAVDGKVVAATHGHGMWSSTFQPFVATHEPENERLVRVSPNPASTTAEFFIEKNDGKTADLRLFDLKGKMVRQAKINGARGRVELAGLPTGTYLFSVSGAGWSRSGKVVKVE